MNGKILERLIDEDFGLDTKENSRWGKSQKHSSLVLDKEKGVFFWNSQEIVGDALIYLTKVRGMSFADAKSYLKSQDGYESTFVYTVKANNQQDIVVFPELVDVFHDLGRTRREYWYKRGINDNTIDRYQLGWYNGYNTIPIFVDGTFRNFQLRQDVPEKRIKGYYRGVGPLIYNSDVLRVTDKVFVSEGLTDCLRLNQEGIPAVSHNTGAGGWVNSWFKYFINQKEVYVIFDNDTAGREGSEKVAKCLGLYRTKIYTFAGEEQSYDVVKFFKDGGTKQELLDLVFGESKYLFELD